MNAKLLSLPIDALFKLKAELDAAAEKRRHEVFRKGRLVTFEGCQNETLTARIENVGPKNLLLQVLDERGSPVLVRGKWRCDPKNCQPVFGNPFAKPAPKPLFTANDRPALADAGSF
jgi:hypothetical protein